MAEDSEGVRSKRLLLVALILAGLVVVVYNYHIEAVRTAVRGRTVWLIRLKHDMEPGARIRADDVQLEEVGEELARGLGSVIKLDRQRDFAFYSDQELAEKVEVNQFLRPEHLSTTRLESPTVKLGPGMVAVPLMLDPRLSPGEILLPGDRVNIVCEFEFKGLPPRLYRVIEGIRVHTVGGKGVEDTTMVGRGSLAGKGVRAYRNVTVEVKESVALKLAELTKEKIVRVEVLSSDPQFVLPPNAGEIDPEVERLAKESRLLWDDEGA